MRQAGRFLPEYRRLRERHTILELCENPRLAAEVTLQPLRRFPFDAAILFADILLPARAMGLRLEFLKGEGPSLSPRVESIRQIERLREFDPSQELGFVLEAIRLVRREVKVPLIGFAGAPFTLASYLVEGGPSSHYLKTKALMHGDPKAWDLLMAKLTRVTAGYLRAQIEAGAQAVQVFDSWVGCLSREDFAKFVLPYSTRVIDEVADHFQLRPTPPPSVRRTGEHDNGLSPTGSAQKIAKVPIIYFGTGTAGFLEDFASTGADVIGVDWRVPLGRAWRRLGANQAIQGNLDPAILASAPLPALKKAVAAVLGEARGRPGHIFNLGHGILPSTPIDNVCAVVDWVHELSSR